jgi:tRNA G18 (ribose-2'-O)-methylase SpoU
MRACSPLGVPLQDFAHPLKATYVLGSEDNGLPESVIAACDHHVAVPSVRASSFNVAVAGSLVMYDRMLKQHSRNKDE